MHAALDGSGRGQVFVLFYDIDTLESRAYLFGRVAVGAEGGGLDVGVDVSVRVLQDGVGVASQDTVVVH